MTLRVAVTGVSGDVGLGAIIGLRAGALFEEEIWILGLDASTDCVGFHLADAWCTMPLVADTCYISRLLDVLQENFIDVVLLGINTEVAILSRSRAVFNDTGITVILAPEPLVEAADDKLATADFLATHGIATPTTAEPDAELAKSLGFPLVAKPRRGQGSQGVFTLASESMLYHFLAEGRQDYCIQEHIEGPEITLGLLYDRDGSLCDAIAMERSLEAGRTVRGTTTRSPAIDALIEAFGSQVPGIGAVNAQLRVDAERGPLVFEVNARLSGSTAMRVAAGFNDPIRLVRHFGLGHPMPRAIVDSGTFVRNGSVVGVRRA